LFGGTVTAIAGESDTPDYVDPVAGITLLGGRSTINVSSDSALTTALQNAQPGQTIQLNASTFAGNYTVDSVAPSNNPVIIKGAAGFGSTFTGRVTTTGDYNILNGLLFSGAGAGMHMRGTNNKALACGFTGTTANAIQLDVESSPGQQSEIAYCEFWALDETPGDLFRQAIKMNTAGSGQPQTAQDDVWIHHNYFHDIDTAQYGQGDLIEWGESGNYDWALTRRIGLYFEDNLIERFLRGSNTTIDAKIGGCVIRRNTQRGGGATKFSARTGEANIFESNYLDPGAITSFGRDHIYVGNYVTGGRLRPSAGDTGPDTLSNGHNAAYDNLITGNIGNLSVGHQIDGGYNVPASGIIIEEHTGSITTDLAVGTVDNRSLPSSRNFVPAVEKQVSEVGPDALANAPATYRASRIPASIIWLSGTEQSADTIGDWENWMGDPVLTGTNGPVTQMEITGAFSINAPYQTNWNRIAYLGSDTQESNGTPYNFERCMRNVPVNIPIVFIMGFVPTDNAYSNAGFNNPNIFTRINSGEFDIYYQRCGDSLISKSQRNSRDITGNNLIISLGHEMTGDWYAHSVGDSITAYKQSWTHIISILKSKMPNLKFEWRPAKRQGGVARNVSYADMMPDPATIDYLSLSLHDDPAHFVTNASIWDQYYLNDNGTNTGLNTAVAVARSLSIPFCLGEWRPQITDCPNPQNPGYFTESPNPELFMQYTYDFCAANRDIMAYDLYLTSSCSRLESRPTHIAAQRYKMLWRPEVV
jgi:hypothetical protein